MTNLTDKFTGIETQTSEVEGISTGDNDNILFYLRQLSIYIGKQLALSSPQDLSAVMGCADTVESTTVVYESGRSYAQWDGVTVPYTNYATAPDHTAVSDLHVTFDPYWSGSLIYVSSNTARTFRLNDSDPREYAIGQTIALAGGVDYPLLISVDGHADVHVQLCTSILATGPGTVEYTLTSDVQGGYNCPVWTIPPAATVSGDGGTGQPAGPFSFNAYGFGVGAGAQVKYGTDVVVAHMFYRISSTWSSFTLTADYQDIPAGYDALWAYSLSAWELVIKV